jgi:hypothetical protein
MAYFEPKFLRKEIARMQHRIRVLEIERGLLGLSGVVSADGEELVRFNCNFSNDSEAKIAIDGEIKALRSRLDRLESTLNHLRNHPHELLQIRNWQRQIKKLKSKRKTPARLVEIEYFEKIEKLLVKDVRQLVAGY